MGLWGGAVPLTFVWFLCLVVIRQETQGLPSSGSHTGLELPVCVLGCDSKSVIEMNQADPI